MPRHAGMPGRMLMLHTWYQVYKFKKTTTKKETTQQKKKCTKLLNSSYVYARIYYLIFGKF